MGDSRKLDASQRQELAWLLDEADSAVQSWLQAEQVRWPGILTRLISRLRLCGFDLEAEGIASDVQASPKIGRQGCRNHRDLMQLRQQVVDRVRKRIVAIRKVMAALESTIPTDKPPGGRTTPKSITKHEAEAVARHLDKYEVTFLRLTAKEMAERIKQKSGKPCSETLVKGLPYWDEAMEATGRRRKRGGKAKGRGRDRGTAARPMNFSKNLEFVTGEGKKQEVLEELVEAEETAKAEQYLREQAQAIHLVKTSRLEPEEQRQTIAKLKTGEMTPQDAVKMVSLLEQDPKRNRKKTLSHD